MSTQKFDKQEQLEVSQDFVNHVHYFYFRANKTRHRVGMCVIHSDPNDDHIQLASSFCVPEDLYGSNAVEFDPNVGLELALNRFASGDYISVERGDWAYALHTAGVRKDTNRKGNETYATLGPITTCVFVNLMFSLVSSANVLPDTFRALRVGFYSHASTAANAERWASHGDALDIVIESE